MPRAAGPGTARPAVRHAALADLARAVAVAEAIVADPGILPALNQASLRLRGKHGRGAAAPSPGA